MSSKYRDFAKLYNTKKGQILARVDVNDDDKPCLDISVSPVSSGVSCSLAITFPDHDAAYDALEKVTQELAEEYAEKHIYAVLREAGFDG